MHRARSATLSDIEKLNYKYESSFLKPSKNSTLFLNITALKFNCTLDIRYVASLD